MWMHSHVDLPKKNPMQTLKVWVPVWKKKQEYMSGRGMEKIPHFHWKYVLDSLHLLVKLYHNLDCHYLDTFWDTESNGTL